MLPKFEKKKIFKISETITGCRFSLQMEIVKFENHFSAFDVKFNKISYWERIFYKKL